MESRVASFTGEDPARHGGGSSRFDGRNKKGASMTETHEEHDDNPFVAALTPRKLGLPLHAAYEARQGR